jgi:hypothetical protein
MNFLQGDYNTLHRERERVKLENSKREKVEQPTQFSVLLWNNVTKQEFSEAVILFEIRKRKEDIGGVVWVTDGRIPTCTFTLSACMGLQTNTWST